MILYYYLKKSFTKLPISQVYFDSIVIVTLPLNLVNTYLTCLMTMSDGQEKNTV